MIYSQVALILIGSFWAPWWWIAVVGIAYGWRFAKKYSVGKIIYSSFLSAFMVWAIFSYYFDMRSQGQVSQWLAHLIHMPSSYLVYLITGGVGGCVSAFSSYVGVKINKN